MEDLLKEATETIEEVQEAAPIIAPEPEGGFPWCGAGIVVLVVVAAVIGRKLLKK